ncbi:MAG: PP2C family serine/threonine-protein phosphatase [Solirubrobacteraceae bacterium]
MSEPRVVQCPACGASLQEGDAFCEQCGARLPEAEAGSAAASPPAGCRACGAPVDAIDADGYCTVCGVRVRPPHSHEELELTGAAAVSDQGRVQRRNEDAFHLVVVGEHSGAVVVCDGVSSASAGDAAARNAAQAAGELLALAAADPQRDAGDATVQAIGAARAAVEQTRWTTRVDRDTPSCTLVSALWRDRELVVGWVGDSRAYWLAGGEIRQVTVDESWAEVQVQEGRMTADVAAHDRRSHQITNWVGPDAPQGPPRLAEVPVDRAGRLILCTDGLWNYLSGPDALVSLLDALPSGAAPAAIARSLTDYALECGGRDNITVAVVDVDPS